jgi:hypothetical protein
MNDLTVEDPIQGDSLVILQSTLGQLRKPVLLGLLALAVGVVAFEMFGALSHRVKRSRSARM